MYEIKVFMEKEIIRLYSFSLLDMRSNFLVILVEYGQETDMQT